MYVTTPVFFFFFRLWKPFRPRNSLDACARTLKVSHYKYSGFRHFRHLNLPLRASAAPARIVYRNCTIFIPVFTHESQGFRRPPLGCVGVCLCFEIGRHKVRTNAFESALGWALASSDQSINFKRSSLAPRSSIFSLSVATMRILGSVLGFASAALFLFSCSRVQFNVERAQRLLHGAVHAGIHPKYRSALFSSCPLA